MKSNYITKQLTRATKEVKSWPNSKREAYQNALKAIKEQNQELDSSRFRCVCL